MKITKIVMITSGQPSLNPRLVKEADALVAEGYEVIVIYQYWNDWGTIMDEELLSQKKWKAIRAGGSPNDKKLLYWFTRFTHKIGYLIANHLFKSSIVDLLIIGRCTHSLIALAKLHKANLYIGHNLAALPAAVKAAKQHGAKCGFDAEDFHRNETTNNKQHPDYQLKVRIENEYLPKVDYLTTASSFIAKAYKHLYPILEPLVINNVFLSSFSQSVILKKQDLDLKLFWFSQTIGKNRGIEDAIKAIALLKRPNINLTLLGKINKIDLDYFLALADQLGLAKNQLNFIPPVQPNNIFKLANSYDIGLALEPAFCLNNDIALSNKIFTYLTSGLAVIASETLAQKVFLNKYPLIGMSFPIGNVSLLAKIIDRYDQDRAFLYQTKLNSFQLATERLNWELESIKFIKIIKQTLLN